MKRNSDHRWMHTAVYVKVADLSFCNFLTVLQIYTTLLETDKSIRQKLISHGCTVVSYLATQFGKRTDWARSDQFTGRVEHLARNQKSTQPRNRIIDYGLEPVQDTSSENSTTST